MHYAKLKTSAEAGGKLRALRQRTGLTPNLLARLALVLSLEEGRIGPDVVVDEGGLEFNAYTLTGELTGMFLTMVRLVETTEEDVEAGRALTMGEVVDRMRAHIHRGTGTLAVRAKSPGDVARLARANQDLAA